MATIVGSRAAAARRSMSESRARRAAADEPSRLPLADEILDEDDEHERLVGRGPHERTRVVTVSANIRSPSAGALATPSSSARRTTSRQS